MSEMDSILPSVLSYINEGIVIVTNDLRITYWNLFMEKLMDKKQETVLDRNIKEVIPYLDQNFFKRAVKRLITDGTPVFFSAAMHRKMIDSDQKVNLKMNRVVSRDEHAILLEFIDVTNQFLRINQLRDYVKQLSNLNNELKQKEKVIEKLAYYDQLTGVANRALFDKFADKYLKMAKLNQQMLGLMFIDVNEFKSINDTYGHNTGDKVMTRVASLLTESIRKDDIVCRYGGDEFLILLPDIQTYDNYCVISKQLKEKGNRQIVQDGFEISLSLSIGVSFFPDDGETIEELVAKADQFMYANKNTFRLR